MRNIVTVKEKSSECSLRCRLRQDLSEQDSRNWGTSPRHQQVGLQKITAEETINVANSPVVFQIGGWLQSLPRTATIKQKQTDKIANVPTIKMKPMKPMNTAQKRRIVVFTEFKIPILYRLKLLWEATTPQTEWLSSRNLTANAVKMWERRTLAHCWRRCRLIQPLWKAVTQWWNSWHLPEDSVSFAETLAHPRWFLYYHSPARK